MLIVLDTVYIVVCMHIVVDLFNLFLICCSCGLLICWCWGCMYLLLRFDLLAYGLEFACACLLNLLLGLWVIVLELVL